MFVNLYGVVVNICSFKVELAAVVVLGVIEAVTPDGNPVAESVTLSAKQSLVEKLNSRGSSGVKPCRISIRHLL